MKHILRYFLKMLARTPDYLLTDGHSSNQQSEESTYAACLQKPSLQTGIFHRAWTNCPQNFV
jgi:hypothetical protein